MVAAAQAAVPGLPAMSASVELGRRLFQDKHLSADGRTSCASCHDPANAFCDNRPVAVGVFGRRGTRNTPSLLGISRAVALTWDGRRSEIEAQIRDAFFNRNELGLVNEAQLSRKLPSGVETRAAFSSLAAYVRTFEPGVSAYDRYHNGRADALSSAQFRGLELFQGRARCAECHRLDATDGSLTDRGYHSGGLEDRAAQRELGELTRKLASLDPEDRFGLIPLDPHIAALGRFVVTLDPRDLGVFRTPSLRDVTRTGPYFHDGSVATLGAAVDREIYYRGESQPLVLSVTERADLTAFLEALTSSLGATP